MTSEIRLHVNGRTHKFSVAADVPLLYVLRNDLGLKGPKFGCGEEQCGAYKVLVDGQAVPSCQLAVGSVQNMPIITVEGLGTADALHLHPLQAAFIEEQAIQCGYCAAGLIMAAQGLLNRIRYPTDDDIRQALADNICRCGVYDRVRRAIKLRIGRPADSPIYETGTMPSSMEANPPETALPRSLQQTPELDRWIRINEDGTIMVYTGKVELGQGLKTAVAQIVADELDVSLSRIEVVMADTGQTPNEGLTAGSVSLETSGRALCWAAAAARQQLLAVAYEALEAPLQRLTVNDGTITDPATGRSLTYWELLGGQRFGRRITGTAPPKRPQAHTIVGQPASRLDLPAKVTGTPVFVHDLELPHMAHGRVVRPPHAHARLVSVDTDAILRLPGVLKVVRDGRFLAVIAQREEQAIQAMTALQKNAVWEGDPGLAPADTLVEELYSQPPHSFLIVDGTATDAPIPPATRPPQAKHTLTATYRRPYQMHASLGPSAAVAHMHDGKLTLWTHSQGVFPLRGAIAHVLGMAETNIHVIHRDGAGCYGHNGADDAALDAALLARALPGRPISLKWTRADEHRWEPYAPAMKVRMQASLNEAGGVVDWHHEVWSPTHLGRSRSGADTSGLLAAWYLAEPFTPPTPVPSRSGHGGSHRNADPLYAFARRRIVKHHLPHTPFRTSAMRSLGAFANVFAIESFMDELAHAAGVDPVAFRLRHLADRRARAVIEAAAEKANWQAGSQRPGEGRGRGLAFAQYKNRQTYAAVVVDLHVNADSGEIHLERVVIAADSGQIVNPDGLSNQLEGGFVQSASLTLMEQVLWNEEGVLSRDWDSYPVLRFPEAPVIEVVLLDRPDQPTKGAGEATMGPTPAAIANAVFAAIGVRLREIPFTPARVQVRARE